tara:strand:- start:238 stop:588 length:351 start_codon:yes stop_codon:yes gene_type:complete
MDLFLKLPKRLHLVKASLPSQPLFDLFKIYRGVYYGGIAMHKNTGWEMHPDGDETLTLLSGLIHLVFEEADGERTIVLKPGESEVIPAGIWHRQIVVEPGELLFMTFGDTTKHRPL